MIEDEALFLRAKSLHECYRNLPRNDYPKLIRHAAKVISMFGSTCACEGFFFHFKKCKIKSKVVPYRQELKKRFKNCCQPVVSA